MRVSERELLNLLFPALQQYHLNIFKAVIFICRICHPCEGFWRMGLVPISGLVVIRNFQIWYNFPFERFYSRVAEKNEIDLMIVCGSSSLFQMWK